MNVPEDLHYAQSHEWLRLDHEIGTVGISDHAQSELTDVVYVELPKIGAQINAGEQVCVVESVKAASDIYTPVSGTITEINEALSANPALLNTDPFSTGWIYKVRLSTPSEVSGLKKPAEYLEQISAGH